MVRSIKGRGRTFVFAGCAQASRSKYLPALAELRIVYLYFTVMKGLVRESFNPMDGVSDQKCGSDLGMEVAILRYEITSRVTS